MANAMLLEALRNMADMADIDDIAQMLCNSGIDPDGIDAWCRRVNKALREEELDPLFTKDDIADLIVAIKHKTPEIDADEYPE